VKLEAFLKFMVLFKLKRVHDESVKGI